MIKPSIHPNTDHITDHTAEKTSSRFLLSHSCQQNQTIRKLDILSALRQETYDQEHNVYVYRMPHVDGALAYFNHKFGILIENVYGEKLADNIYHLSNCTT